MKFEIIDLNETITTNINYAIGYASRCWDKDNVFDTTRATKVSDELTAYFELLLKSYINKAINKNLS